MRCGGSVNAVNVDHHHTFSLSSLRSLIAFRYPKLG